MRRPLKYLLWIPVSAILLAIVALFLLIATVPGTRWLISIAASSAPGELTVADSRGTLLSGLTLEDVGYLSSDLTLHADSLTMDWRPRLLLARGLLSLEKLHLSNVEVILPASAREQNEQPFVMPEIFTPVALEVDSFRVQQFKLVQGDTQQLVHRLELAASFVGSRLRIDRAELDSEVASASLSGAFAMSEPFGTDLKIDWELRLPEFEPFSGSGNFKGNLHDLKVRHRLVAPIELGIEGAVDLLADTPALDIAVSWDRIDWLPAGFPAIEPLGVVSSTGGELRVKGTFNRYQLKLDTAFESEQLPVVDLSLSGEGDHQQFQVQNLQLRALDGTLDAQGKLQWLPEQMADFRLQGRDLPMQQLLPQAYIPEVLSSVTLGRLTLGRLSLDAEVKAQSSGELPDIWLSVSSLDGAINDKALRVSGELALSQQVLTMNRLQVVMGSNHFAASGRLDDNLRLDLKINAPSLDNILPGLQGEIYGDLALGGTRREPQASIDLKAKNPGFAGSGADSVTVVGEIDLQGRKKSNIVLEATELKFGEQVIHQTSIKVSGVPSAHTMAARIEHDMGRLKLGLKGAWSGTLWQGQLTDSEIAPPNFAAWQQNRPVALSVGAQQLQLQSSCWQQGDSQLCLAADVLADSYHVRGELGGFDLQSLQGILPNGVTLTGGAEADFEVRGNVGGKTPAATIHFNYSQPQSVLRYRGENTEDEVVETRFNTLKIQANGTTERLSVDGVMAGEHTGETRLQLTLEKLLSDTASLSGSMTTRIEDIGFLAGLHAAIGDIGGAFAIQAQVDGLLRQPQVQGRLQWQGGHLQLPRVGTDLQSINLTLAVKGQENAIASSLIASNFELRGSANSGKGQVAINGSGSFTDLSRWTATGVIDGQDFQAVKLPDMDILVSPNIEFTGQPESLRLRGSLAIPQTEIVLKQLPESAVNTSPDAVVHRADSDGTKQSAFAVDAVLDLQLGDAVHLRGFGLDTHLTGKLALVLRPDGTTQANGVLDLVGGEFAAYGQKLTVERGTMVYAGPLDNPALDVRAVRKVGDVTVGLLIRGLAKNPETTVFSEPSMPEAEALAYLLLGRPLAQSGEGDGQMLQNAAIALGLKQVLPIAQQISSALGIDELTVEGDSTEGTAITAGQNIGSRLSLKYSYGVFSRIGALILEYRLNKNLSLETRAGEASSIDLIYSVEKD